MIQESLIALEKLIDSNLGNFFTLNIICLVKRSVSGLSMMIQFNPRRIYDIILVHFKRVKQVFLVIVGLYLLLPKGMFLALENASPPPISVVLIFVTN